RVTRGFDGNKPQAANPDLVAVAKPSMRELIVAASRRRDGGTGRSLDLQRPGQVIVMNVGFEDVPDRESPLLGDLEEAPGVALGINHHRFAPGPHQVAVVAQSWRDEQLEVHGISLP